MSVDGKTPEEVCREVVAASGSSFAISFRFLPERERRGMEAIYAFCRRTDDIVDEPGEMAAKHEALRAWHADLISGSPSEPINRALRAAAEEFRFSLVHPQAVIQGCEEDLKGEGFQDFYRLEEYCAKVAGAVGHMCLAVWDVRGPEADRLAEDLGLAAQLTNILRDVGEDARRGRNYLPQEVLRVNGAKVEDVLAGNLTPGVRRALEYVGDLAARAYERADFQAFSRDERRRLWPAMIIRDIYRALLRKIVASGFDVFSRRHRVSKARRGWIAARVMIGTKLR